MGRESATEMPIASTAGALEVNRQSGARSWEWGRQELSPGAGLLINVGRRPWPRVQDTMRFESQKIP